MRYFLFDVKFKKHVYSLSKIRLNVTDIKSLFERHTHLKTAKINWRNILGQ